MWRANPPGLTTCEVTSSSIFLPAHDSIDFTVTDVSDNSWFGCARRFSGVPGAMYPAPGAAAHCVTTALIHVGGTSADTNAVGCSPGSIVPHGCEKPAGVASTE